MHQRMDGALERLLLEGGSCKGLNLELQQRL